MTHHTMFYLTTSTSAVLFIPPLPPGAAISSSSSRFTAANASLALKYRTAPHPHASVLCLSTTDKKPPGEQGPTFPDEQLLSAFESSIDDLEKDLEKSVSSKLSPAEQRQALRREKHEEILRKQQEKYLKRLHILTSLPTELLIQSESHKCSGCGIKLQSDSSSLPGYLPPQFLSQPTKKTNDVSEKATNVNSTNEKDSFICQRCYRLTHYGTLDPNLRVLTKNAAILSQKFQSSSSLKKKKSKGTSSSPDTTEYEILTKPSPELAPSKFRKCLQKLQSINAVIVYLVDIFDFHGSFIPSLHDVIGSKNPIILALNKVDLLPSDYKQARVQSWIQHECRALNMHNIDAIHFISSVRGTGVSPLLADAIRLARKRKTDIYVVGAANVGKSSFINQLLRKQTKRNNGVKAQTSKMTIEIDEDEEVDDDFMENEKDDPQTEESTDTNMDGNNVDSTTGSIKETLSANEDGLDETRIRKKSEIPKDTLTTSVVPGTTLDVVKIPLGNNVNLFDTPGLMVSHQLTNLLSQSDLRSVVPSKSVEKVSFRLSVGKTLFIGGLARIELTEGRPFFFTCFFSSEVKLHPGRSEDAEAFTRRHAGKMLSPPSSQEGFERLGEWTNKTFSVNGDGWKRSCVDVVLSGLGWISITGAGQARVSISLPKDVGVFTRDPLMPYEIQAGVSTYTGARSVNKREFIQKRKRRVRNGDGDAISHDDFFMR